MSKPQLTRRQAGSLFAAIGGLFFLGCGRDSDSNATSDTGTTDTGTANDTNASGWASGGTKSMTAKASYPDPFVAPSTCLAMNSATEGPCTESADQIRTDISEGYTGLPVRLALRVVDSGCKPISGAKVKIWHTQVTGSYSGDTPNPAMCLKVASDSSKHYFRGVQTTDANGVVDFDTCFPGWYTGRCIHIHFTITSGGKSFTSQLIFDQALIAEIFSTHVDYQSFGQPDTPNASDMVVMGDLASHTLDAAKMTDGAMLASKTLVFA